MIFFKKKKLIKKDPMDFTLTESSTCWQSEYYCPQCKKKVCHSEIMADICNSCGYFGWLLVSRVKRKIYNGEKWVWQYKYGNNKRDYEIVEKEYK